MDTKSRIKQKNSIIDDKNIELEKKQKELEDKDLSVKYLLKKTASYELGMQKLQGIIDVQRKEIKRLEKEKQQWSQDKISQQQVIAQQLLNNDNVVSQLQNELIELKVRLRKYEKVN